MGAMGSHSPMRAMGSDSPMGAIGSDSPITAMGGMGSHSPVGVWGQMALWGNGVTWYYKGYGVTRSLSGSAGEWYGSL